MKRRRKALIMGIFLVLLGLGLGYAFLTTNLSINGVADVDSNTWNIYWDNVQVTSGSIEAETPVIDTNKTAVSFSIHLRQPGDFYEFTVDAKNDGTIDAMIESFNTTVNGETTIPNYLTYTVTYDDNYTITNNQILVSGQYETYKVLVKYRDDIEKENLPGTAQSLNVHFSVSYIQADNNAYEKPISGSYYYTNTDHFAIGDSIVSSNNVYKNQDAATANIGSNIFLQYTLDNNIITEARAGFIAGGNTYYLKGGDGGASYEANQAVLNEVFPTVCQTREDNGVEYYKCYGEIDTYTRAGEPTTSTIEVYEDGKIIVGQSAKNCVITNTSTYCTN